MSEASEEIQLFEERIPIYPRSVKGRFRTLKWTILALAYGVYFLLPWVPWSRTVGPDQAVSFDLATRRFYLFDLVVHAQDIFWLAGILAIAALLLFMVTGIAGRVFCGYFCFQTLWTDVYIAIERLVQGERPARIRLAKSPWNGRKLARIGATHLLWLAVAFWTGFTFTLYWARAPELFVEFFTGVAPFAAYATTLFLTATTYVMAGLAREQVCQYMCPYARFQGAMFDRDTLIVAYDEQRGEGSAGRHKVAKGFKRRDERQAEGVGDCIDCGYCVQVCPAGIDIRNGLQYQCISCALCIDACNHIMDTLGWERGLIRYTSEKEQEGEKTRIIKPKTIGYGVMLAAIISLLSFSIATRAPLDMAVYQVRNPLYVLLSDGSIQNSYEVKLNNKTEHSLDLTISVYGLPGAAVDLGRLHAIHLAPEQSLRVMARVRLHPTAREDKPKTFHFKVSAEDGSIAPLTQPVLFYMPKHEESTEDSE